MMTVDQMSYYVAIDGVEMFYCPTKYDAFSWLEANIEPGETGQVFTMGDNKEVTKEL